MAASELNLNIIIKKNNLAFIRLNAFEVSEILNHYQIQPEAIFVGEFRNKNRSNLQS